ncbi:MAG: YlxR family protein [Myxococcaceae bacterium]
MSAVLKQTGARPERTCLGCGQRRPKASLHRLVLDKQAQPVLDTPQTAPGRGAYLCGAGCLKAAAKRRAFQRAFRGKMTSLEMTRLEAALQGVPQGT